jgi:hypothetical protein
MLLWDEMLLRKHTHVCNHTRPTLSCPIVVLTNTAAAAATAVAARRCVRLLAST